MIKLSDYKDNIKSKTIVEELTHILHILNFTLDGLTQFNYYSPVKDLTNELKNAKIILEIHKNNHERKLDENKVD